MPENIKAFCVCSVRNSIVLERFSVGSRKRIKTVVWTRIVDRCVFDDNENAYFWKHISVDRASDKCFQTCGFFKKKRMFVFNEPIQYYHSSKMNEFQSRVAPSCLVLFKKLSLFLKISNSNWIDPDNESDRVNKNNEVLLYKVQRPQPPGLCCTY